MVLAFHVMREEPIRNTLLVLVLPGMNSDLSAVSHHGIRAAQDSWVGLQ
jgi:hypothetical protein